MLVQLSAGSQNFLLHANKQECSIRHCCLAPVTNYGLLTEPKFYIVKSALTQIPTSSGQNSSLVEGFHLLLHESGLVPLFHPLSGSFGQKKWGVPGVPRCASLVRICPRDHFPCRKKKNYLATHSLAGRVNFVISFVEVFSLICTQTA